ncbi:N-acetyltransferase family protein [Leucobacter allii]|uniref:N-acetyltransferase family protein n=1 Tax=Leucobacter allii TaxID=2932247 RepID=A0ABY4FJ28_9MICO|nr:GNAT family N-acetyltransferase [Leucobacter allii]UOQ56674.1 N-acetyltransferase family protein [Leucobacter allii]
MEIRDATPAELPGIAAILNEAIARSTAVWSSQQVTAADREAWLAEHERLGYPVLVAVDEAAGGREVLGYAAFGAYRGAFDGYRHTVEHSVYVRADRQGLGVGRALMEALVVRARRLGKHVMVAAIDAANTGSIAMHERLGFERAGVLREVGAKFGGWRDLAYLTLALDARDDPDPDPAARR